MASLTTKDLFGIPGRPRENLRLKLIELENATGSGDLDAAALFTSAANFDDMLVALASGVGIKGMVGVHKVRGRITANVADLGAFTVAGNDGLTYAAGERIYLDGQSTGAQKGIYVVGTVGAGVAPLTRALDWAAADIIPTGTLVVVDAGTANGNQILMVTNTGDVTVATTIPALTPLVDDTRFHATTVADANAVGGIPVVHRVLIAAGANGDTDVVLTNKTRVIDATIVLKGAGTAGCTITVKNGATAISDAVDLSAGGDRDRFDIGEIDDAQHEIAAAGTLRISKASTGADFPGCEVYVYGLPVA